MTHRRIDSRSAGFTLIEALIVLAIVGVLTAIAIPTYTGHVARGHRAQARAQLQLAAQYMQRFYAANDSYESDRAGKPVAELIPAQFLQSPGEGDALYRLEFGAGASIATATEFKLVISPVPGRAMADDACGGYTLDSAGRRGMTVSGATREACWR